ncbi:MarR family transcriptional regulator [Anaerotignum lactatifermentans]|uniref:MarR family transcriptional regulator n=1 Tax=Anaerotignum lactatifermentans TaxID=160404 RepID=A0ABS2G561_9FIRM|nr:MarR family transcriptional regulator [Anaerotignum lactatifermentans]MBM6828268.1 MarR family transcriptional regulator [Anaerotignum lactatifermentans]MBM6876569.1 MarR family transcriptional regulator [Anaerotignum lactatifermentans]MBM6949851.1 MarR family transcriptional regulator [Anaerotignum lactatifermentans]
MEKSFHHLLLLAQTAFQKQVVLEAAAQGLLPGQSKMLDFLAEHDGCEQKVLGQKFHLEPATVTGILKRMEESGLICRQLMEGNKKSRYVYLTEKGKRLALETVRPIFSACEAKALEGLSGEEQEFLREMLEKIYENMMKG